VVGHPERGILHTMIAKRKLGAGLEVSAMGLGCMGMSDFYGRGEEKDSIRVVHRAIDLGVTFLDTSDAYGPYTNEVLVGKAVRGLRDRVVIATKFGYIRDESGAWKGICGRPDFVAERCDGSLKRLGVDHIDLYYQHRVDPEVPIEETVGAMARLVEAGKVRWLGLSEAAPETIRRARRVHPIAALQTEYSLWSRDPEKGHLATCRELGIGFVSYSPLGRAFLAGAFRKPEDVPEGDSRRLQPRFQGGNFERNLRLADGIADLAREKRVTPAQVCLAWVLSRGEDVVPIPGTKRLKYLEENVAAAGVSLSPDDLARLDDLAPPGAAAGERYSERGMKAVDL
jgi:aryl-alcohol dehydrogenase-like predicted oxidoreductase